MLAGSPRGVLGILNSRAYVHFGDLGWVCTGIIFVIGDRKKDWLLFLVN